ncbi:MAG: AP2 domain-containing protein [Proteobacteria bacterium]|nr:AP2 domain-containing protein [Pseudomonadota bacterium]MBU1714572.1 AP2 domain-containing protein [Pseudomonadota bacterium]
MSKKNLHEKHKDIARIDQEAKCTHGWYVRVRHLGKPHVKFFSDRKNGGRSAALSGALAWRDAKEIELGKKRTDRNIVTTSNNNTGVVGVRFNEKMNRYEISWVTKEGKSGKTSVSTKKCGKEQAFDRACAIRMKKEEERLV